MDVLKYKGFEGNVEIDLERNVCRGKILFIKDLIIYESESISGIKVAFEEAVDDYIETCSDLGIEPEKPLKGVFQIRISPELHKECIIRSIKDGVKLNETVERAINAYIHSKSEVHNSIHISLQKIEQPSITGQSSTSMTRPHWHGVKNVAAH